MVECLPTIHEAPGSTYSTTMESQHLGWLRSYPLLLSKYMRPYVKNKQKYKQKASVNKLRAGLEQGKQWKGKPGNDSECSGWASWVNG